MWDLIVSVPDHCLSFNFKTDFEHERYLDCLQIKRFRPSLAKIRTCSGCPIAERICKLCRLDKEDEAHFILYCPMLHGLTENTYLISFAKTQISINSMG